MAEDEFESPGSNGSSNGDGGKAPGYTGRYIVSFDPRAADRATSVLQNKAGLRALTSLEVPVDRVGSENVVFEEIAAAVVDAPPDQLRALESAVLDTSIPVLKVEPERVVWAAMYGATLDVARPESRPRRSSGDLDAPTASEPARPLGDVAVSLDYLRGYAAGLQTLVDTLAPAQRSRVESNLAQEIELAEGDATWGLVATRVLASAFSGRGIRVAVLDTGMDLHHPDFGGRSITTESFVEGESVQDGHGHGTHCIGTSCGPRNPPTGPRYGVAYGADIYAGKVLSNAGSGTDGGILAGIDWAVRNRCAIVSMSLGAPVGLGETFSGVYQDAARVAASKGTIIIAAAGNDSSRPGLIKPVSHPANCPTILAVGALDFRLAVAFFSNGERNPGGGEVNIAGPGVDVYSSWPMPRRYNTISGTSMATPHVAGIAALYAEATGLRGLALANHVLRRSRRLFPTRDFGWGLTQAG